MFKPDDQARVFGVTPVENLFITEYLPYADGDKTKVYLCGLYHSRFPLGDYNVAQMAADLNMEEGQVLSALRYWERRRLVERVSDNPPTYLFHHLGQRMLTGQDEMAGERGFIEFSETLYAQFGDRRKLRPNDISLSYEWVQDLGLPQEVVLMLLNHMSETRGLNFSFKSAQSLAVMMREDGILTTEQAEQYLSHTKRTHSGAKAVLSQFNLRRLPTEPEMALYRKWTEEWGFDDQAVLTACTETTNANNPSFSYLNGILERLKNKGGGTSPGKVEQVLRQENEDAAQAKQVLDILGAKVSVYTVLPAYLDLRTRFSDAMILLAAKSIRARGGVFEQLEPKLAAWQEQGLADEKNVLSHLKELKAFEPLMLKVFEQAGQDGRPGEHDLMRLKGWLSEGHRQDMILEAADQARSSRQKLPYIQRVLESWKKNGIATPEAAKAESAKTPDSRKRKLHFQDYDQGPETPGMYDTGIDLLKEARELHGK
jgi:DnaD/phage-associated family protein